jgi:hypothetical protein
MYQLTDNSFYNQFDTANQTVPARVTSVILGDLCARNGHEVIFQQTIGREIFHEASNSIHLRAPNFAIINNATGNIKLQKFMSWREGTYMMLRKRRIEELCWGGWKLVAEE